MSVVTRRTSKTMSHRCEQQDSPERHGLESNRMHCSRKTRFGSCFLKRRGQMFLHPKAGTLPKVKRELEEMWRETLPHFAPHLLELRPLLPSVGHLCPPLRKHLSTILPYLPEES